MTIAIHTIFVLRENILFMDEWVKYHLSIGFDKIFLYDNSKSIGIDGGNAKINKYQISFHHLTQNISDEELRVLFSAFLKKYSDQVVYLNWEPKDKIGNIVYRQVDGINHYIKNYGELSQWTAFIDIDEFIFSSLNIKILIKRFQSAGAGGIIMFQKKFDSRFNHLDRPTTEIIDCIDGIDTKMWGRKSIIRNKCFDIDNTEFWNVHHLPLKNCKIGTANFEILRFNHYNVSNVLLKWMKQFYNTTSDFTLNGKCKDLKEIFKYRLEKRIVH